MEEREWTIIQKLLYEQGLWARHPLCDSGDVLKAFSLSYMLESDPQSLDAQRLQSQVANRLRIRTGDSTSFADSADILNRAAGSDSVHSEDAILATIAECFKVRIKLYFIGAHGLSLKIFAKKLKRKVSLVTTTIGRYAAVSRINQSESLWVCQGIIQDLARRTYHSEDKSVLGSDCQQRFSSSTGSNDYLFHRKNETTSLNCGEVPSLNEHCSQEIHADSINSTFRKDNVPRLASIFQKGLGQFTFEEPLSFTTIKHPSTDIFPQVRREEKSPNQPLHYTKMLSFASNDSKIVDRRLSFELSRFGSSAFQVENREITRMSDRLGELSAYSQNDPFLNAIHHLSNDKSLLLLRAENDTLIDVDDPPIVQKSLRESGSEDHDFGPGESYMLRAVPPNSGDQIRIYSSASYDLLKCDEQSSLVPPVNHSPNSKEFLLESLHSQHITPKKNATALNGKSTPSKEGSDKCSKRTVAFILPEVKTGSFKFFNEKQGYGFITVCDNGQQSDIFIYRSDLKKSKIPMRLIRKIRKDHSILVSFQVCYYTNNGKVDTKAVNLILVEESKK